MRTIAIILLAAFLALGSMRPGAQEASPTILDDGVITVELHLRGAFLEEARYALDTLNQMAVVWPLRFQEVQRGGEVRIHANDTDPCFRLGGLVMGCAYPNEGRVVLSASRLHIYPELESHFVAHTVAHELWHFLGAKDVPGCAHQRLLMEYCGPHTWAGRWYDPPVRPAVSELNEVAIRYGWTQF